MPYGGRGQQIFDNRALVLKKHGSWERVLSIKITFESSSTNLFILNFKFLFKKVTWDQNNGGWTLIGLLSNGAKSCFEGNPEIYTKVGDYLPWIYDTMRRSEHEVP